MKVFVMLSVILLLSVYSVGTSFGQIAYHDSSYSDSKILLDKTLKINVILFGDTWSNSEISTIKSKLMTSYEPFIASAKDKAGIRYNYQYSFYSASEQDSKALFSHMEKNSREAGIIGDLGRYKFLHAWWILSQHPDWASVQFDSSGNPIVNYRIKYKEINAEEIEKYIHENFISKNADLSNSNSVNLVFIKAGPDKIDYLRNYYVTNLDDSQNKPYTAKGMMGYGGKYNTYFFDLHASPWVDYDFEKREWYIPKGMETLHDCKTNSCFTDLVSWHIHSATHHIITPSFLYPIKYQPKYVVDIVVYSKPGFGTGLSPQLLPYFIDTKKIKSELSELYPFSQWDVKIATANRNDRVLSYDFTVALDATDHRVVGDPKGIHTSVLLLNSGKLQPHLISHASERIKQHSDPSATVIPVLLVVDNTDHAIFLDHVGIMGFAPSLASDEKLPCCALAIANEKTTWVKNIGVTNLLLHEIGHVLGLAHPFHAWESTDSIVRNNYYNWYSSPMMYNFPPSGCGFVYSILYSSPCGMGTTSFTAFEKSRVADAVFVSMVKDANSRIGKSGESTLLLQKLAESTRMFNAGDTNSAIFTLKSVLSSSSSEPALAQKQTKQNIAVPSDFGTLSISSDEVTKSRHTVTSLTISGTVNNPLKGHSVIIKITKPDNSIMELQAIAASGGRYTTTLNIDRNFLLGDYVVTAEYLKEKSNPASFTVKDTPTVSTSPPPVANIVTPKPTVDQKIDIPSWVRNNAKWWSEGAIGDNDFVQGIQFLVNQGIIKVSAAKSSGSSSDAMPSWIKNNAKWWSEGSISDEDFVRGIQFMIENGIIKN